MNEEKELFLSGDDIEKAIERYTYEMDDGEECIPIDVLKQILDHFMPKWRKRTDKYYKLKKFVTEQQMDSNISKLRNYIDENNKRIIQEIQFVHEFVDEFKAEAAQVKKIIENDMIATERAKEKFRQMESETKEKITGIKDWQKEIMENGPPQRLTLR